MNGIGVCLVVVRQVLQGLVVVRGKDGYSLLARGGEKGSIVKHHPCLSLHLAVLRWGTERQELEGWDW